MEEVEKVHGLHNTGMTMHERFTLLAKQAVGRRKPVPARARLRGQGRTNPAQLEAIIQKLNQGFKPVALFRGGGRGRGALRRAGSEGSLHSLPGLRPRSNSVSYNGLVNNKNHNWRRSNGNLSNYAGSVNGSVYSVGSGRSSQHGYWLRGDANLRRGQGLRGRGRGRGRGGRVNQGRVNRVNNNSAAGRGRGRGRVARGYGRRGMRRLQPLQGQARGGGRARGRGRGGVFRKQPPKPVPTREELDSQLDQYMSGTKAALDQQLDEYMRNAMELE